MPKATRKKKLKAEDFRKTKLKVGKKKPPATNQTDVSFRSQAIVVPSQSIIDEKASSDLVNSRKQSLKDIIVQLKHYNAQTRKDALVGIKDLHNRHPEALHAHLSTLLDALSKLLVDDDGNVRKTLLSFLKDLMPTIPKGHFRPFMSLLMAYTCSAMTHISEDIRLDGLRFLRIWQDNYPDLIATYADKVIPNFLSMLSTGGKSQSSSSIGTGSSLLVNPRSQLGSAKSRVDVLDSLHRFLQLVLETGNDTWWFLAMSTRSEDSASTDQAPEFVAYQPRGLVIHGWSEVLGRPHHARSSLRESDHLDLFTATSTSAPHDRLVIDHGGKGENVVRNLYDLAEFDQLKAFTDVIMPVLVDIWLEASPTAFSAGSITLSPALSVMHTVLRMTNLIWRALLFTEKKRADSGWVDSWLTTISKHFAVHFPFGSSNFSLREKQVDTVLQDMNILFCEILSHFLLGGQSSKPEGAFHWRDRMFEYVLELFDGKKTMDRSPRTPATIVSLTNQQLEATYPVLWTLLNTLDSGECADLMRAFLRNAQLLTDLRSARRSFTFICKILKLQDRRQYIGKFKVSANEQLYDIIQKWLLGLPKKLWQLKISDQAFSKDIIDMLAYTLRNDLCGFASDKAFTSGLQTAIIPFFQVTTAKGPLFGPFVDSSPTVQHAAVALLYYLPAWPDKLIRGVATCVTNFSVSADIVGQTLEILGRRQNQPATCLPLEVYASILITVGIVGHVTSEMAALQTQDVSKHPSGRMMIIRGRNEVIEAKLRKKEINADDFWKRRLAITQRALTLLSHPSIDGALFVPALQELMQMQALPVDTYYGIASAIHCIAKSAALSNLVSVQITADISRALIATMEMNYVSGDFHQNRETFVHCFQISSLLLLQLPDLASSVIKMVSTNIQERTRVSADQPSANEICATFKVMTRLILGNEQLRDQVMGGVDSLKELRLMATTLKDLAKRSEKVGTEMLKEEIEMLCRLLGL
ncbi:uncharacterized protein SPPG_01147 [Spizellomyces punctatus DAOM BR117]|uniref:Pre-rRNA-processing protein n=1 Tax=Spizellomyces punctatus (strain DAOM BR117) TaxID=645134 RepID=A0A0L0HS50_SPIPD|nr:uncharacterized protein SPPG_01147 [Spizellomyces punctatus DAOM BR117]KND03679.1 hypothetical protein SPPG_01147 [Spizellomyces punctatus DAOM BR117]|eukprot:XP_016611718.1 hypothetical protein SPPG_01147 [Spizellomyces punctatus DAOM BR117]